MSEDQKPSIFTYTLYGFLMLVLCRPIYTNPKYQYLFLFRHYYTYAFEAIRWSSLVTIFMLINIYIFYPYFLHFFLTTYGIFFVLSLSVAFYLIGLYSLFPLEVTLTQVHFLLAKSLLKDTDGFYVRSNYNYYGLAILLSRLNKASPQAFEEELKLIAELNAIDKSLQEGATLEESSEFAQEIYPLQKTQQELESEEQLEAQAKQPLDSQDSLNSNVDDKSHQNKSQADTENQSAPKNKAKVTTNYKTEPQMADSPELNKNSQAKTDLDKD